MSVFHCSSAVGTCWTLIPFGGFFVYRVMIEYLIPTSTLFMTTKCNIICFVSQNVPMMPLAWWLAAPRAMAVQLKVLSLPFDRGSGAERSRCAAAIRHQILVELSVKRTMLLVRVDLFSCVAEVGGHDCTTQYVLQNF